MKKIYEKTPVGDIANKYPICYFDIGSRGGVQTDLYPISFGVDVIGFEPDPLEFGRLEILDSNPWKSITLLPYGVGAETGLQKLYVPEDPQSASFLKHDKSFGEKFNKKHLFQLDRTETIRTLTLADALEKTDFSSIDFMKVDIEGGELSIFNSCPKVMNELLAIKTEVSFMPFRDGQPLANDLDLFVQEMGFELMDIIDPVHWRRHGNVIHPYSSDETPSYSRGQIVQADYLYFRKPDNLNENIPKTLKLSLIALALGFFDHALMVLENPKVASFLLSEFGKTPVEIVATASKKFGRRVYFHALYRQIRGLIPFVRYSKNL